MKFRKIPLTFLILAMGVVVRVRERKLQSTSRRGQLDARAGRVGAEGNRAGKGADQERSSSARRWSKPTSRTHGPM